MNVNDTMQRLNPHALYAQEGSKHIFVEDVQDPDGRWYRLEYQCNSDGSNAHAWVRHNPWGNNPHSYHESHLASSGKICVSTGTNLDLDFVVERARFWCTGYSYLREHGYSATRAMLPEWG